MKKIKMSLAFILSITISFLCTACNNNNGNNSSPKTNIVGIAVFQNSSLNEVWDTIYENPALANSLIVTKNNKISYNGTEVEHLFYVYASSTISDNLSKADFFSNTTFLTPILQENSFEITMEVYPEVQELMIFVITKDSKYTLTHIKTLLDFTESEKEISINLSNSNIDKINLTLSRNLTINDDYKNSN